MTLLLSFVIGYLIAFTYERVMLFIGKKLKKKSIVVLGYKLHHSIYGLIFIAISLFIQPAVLFIGVGLGIIVQHYFTGDGLVFITKD